MGYFIRLIQIIKRNIVFCISVTGALILHLVIAWQSLGRLEGFSLTRGNGPLIDDSYIFFNLSKNIADWFSGYLPSLQLSTGYQPLIALLYTPLFHFFWTQKELPIHLALSLNAVIGFLANISLYCLLRKIVSRPIATFLVSVWVWSPYVMNQTINGMETTLALLMLLVTLNYYWKIKDFSSSKPLSWFFLGIFIGVGFWARVDLAIIGFAIVLDQLWLMMGDDRPSRSIRLRNVLLCAMTALIISSPWILFTIIRTGTLLPISGRAVHLITSVLLNYSNPNNAGFFLMMLLYFKDTLLMYQPLTILSGNIFWQLCISGLSIGGFILALKERTLLILFRPMWVFQTIIVLSYIFIIGGYWHLYRYLYPVLTLLLFLHAASLRYLASRFKLKPWILGITLFILFIPYALSYTFQYYTLWTRDPPPRFFSAAHFVKDFLPPESKVGAFQSGCLSYWLDNQVINLDGVINEQVYYHLRDKTVDIYLEEQKIDYLIDELYLFGMWNHYLEGQLSRYYKRIALKKKELHPLSLYTWGIYKRKIKKRQE
jgi:hypothetical protein